MFGSLGGHCDRPINAITGTPESKETTNTNAKEEKGLGTLGNFIHFHSMNPASILKWRSYSSYRKEKQNLRKAEKLKIG